MLISIPITDSAPLDTNSKPILPLPEKSSNTLISSKSILPPNTLNKPSFAKSVVGRAFSFVGGVKRLPLSVPLIILIEWWYYCIERYVFLANQDMIYLRQRIIVFPF